MRLMQHKQEAYWFYRYLSVFYDKLVNPLFWTERMRDKALDLGEWDGEEDLRVIDVGSGTGFTTEGIVSRVPANNVTCVDQSPHQMQHARRKPELQACTFREGDAENIPFPNDSFDRYVSAGSIEYWPDPQLGVNESYRVIKPGGWALLIGPLEPVNPISKFAANTWMLFPKEEEYHEYYREAGFTNVRHTYVAPSWQSNERYGIALLGQKPTAGPSPSTYRPVAPERSLVDSDANGYSLGRGVLLAGRVLVGSAAGFLFIPMALLASVTAPLRGIEEAPEPLNREQRSVLIGLGAAVGTYLLYRAFRRN